MRGLPEFLRRAVGSLRAAGRAAVFFLKVFPFLPSRPVDWLTGPPVVERVRYPGRGGQVEGDLYRPSRRGPHPGILVCLGVVPFEVDHPQVPVLGRALAQSGFAALLFWSPEMRAFRLDPGDVENLALAYEWLLARPDVDASRSGLLGTCVGGSFALLAAAHPLARGRVSFLAAYAPFSSMHTFAADIAAGVRSTGGADSAAQAPWQVDPLTRKVFTHSLTAGLEPDEAERLRSEYSGGRAPYAGAARTPAGQAVEALLSAPDRAQAAAALGRLPPALRARLDALSPLNVLDGLDAPLIILLHDREDAVIPVGESRRLHAALAGRPGVQYTEMNFQHLDPTKGRLPFWKLARELGKFLRAVFPLFRRVA